MSCRLWNQPDKGNYDQDNNAVEYMTGRIVYKEAKIYRESCSATAFTSIIEALGVFQPKLPFIQLEDYYMMAVNNPENGLALPNLESPANRYIENWAALGKRIFPSLKFTLDTNLTEAHVREVLKAPNTGIMFLLKDPGHYISGLHIDENDMVHYNDSWLGNYWNKSNTHKRSISLYELCKNLKYKMLVISM